MDIGVGLPVASPGVTGEDLVEWAQRAEGYGFSSVAAIDRLVYDCFEPMITLAALATTTKTIQLTTSVLVSPLWANGALLAKQAATLDRLSGGRFTLGLGVGWRPDDYEASAVEHSRRGQLMDEQLETMRRVWAGESFGHAGRIGPAPTSPAGPRILFGGAAPAVIRRIAEYGDGWIGVGRTDLFSSYRERIESAWSEYGRSGKPRYVDFTAFALGPDGRRIADDYLLTFYGIAPGIAKSFASRTPTSPGAIKELVSTAEQLGIDELQFGPCSHDLHQLELLAEAVFG